MQFGFDTSTQNPNVLIGFGLTTAVVVSHGSQATCYTFSSIWTTVFKSLACIRNAAACSSSWLPPLYTRIMAEACRCFAM